jgi:hypothetical protein
LDLALAVSMIESVYAATTEAQRRQQAFGMYTSDGELVRTYFLRESVLQEGLPQDRTAGRAVGDGNCAIDSALQLRPPSIPIQSKYELRCAVMSYVKGEMPATDRLRPANKQLFEATGQLRDFACGDERQAWARSFSPDGEYVGEEFLFVLGLMWERNVALWVNTAPPDAALKLTCIEFRHDRAAPDSEPLEFAFVNHNHFIPVFSRPPMQPGMFAALHAHAPVPADPALAEGKSPVKKKPASKRRPARCMNPRHHGPPGSRATCPGLNAFPKKCPWTVPRDGCANPLPLPAAYKRRARSRKGKANS